jgi:MarR family transcriptional regulator, organic hydroperoxide resistance regulator
MEGQREKTQQIMHSFRKVTWALYHLLREEAAVHQTTVVQLSVLRVLSKRPQMSLSELAKELLLSNSTMSGVIDRLVAGGLVNRDRAKDDRRSIVLKLTELGKEKQREAFGEHSSLAKKLSKILEIPEDDLQHLLRTHELIVEKLNQNEGEK